MARSSWGGGTAKPTGSSSYRDILSGLAESLKPGGDIDKSLMADIDIQGKQLQNQLSAGAIGRGLGNAQLGIPTQVFKNVNQAKSKARTGLLEQYMSIMANLAQLSFQEEQANANRATQVPQTPMGYSQAGTKLTDFGLNKLNFAGGGGPSPAMQTMMPTARSYPSLYAAGGMGGGDIGMAPSLFGGTEPTGGGEDFGNLLELNPGLASLIG